MNRIGKCLSHYFGEEDYFDESGVGSFRFWYGGGVGLNFGSGFNTSQFNFSVIKIFPKEQRAGVREFY